MKKYINLALFFVGTIAATEIMADDAKKMPLKISADTALEWRREAHQYVARGNVVITQGDMTLMADQVIADYRDDKNASNASDSSGQKGGMNIYRLTATGKVVTLKTATETAVGTRAVYDHETNQAVMDGPVTITRGADILRGARATVDLTTKKSMLLGDPKSGGRVTGVFYTQGVKGK